MDVVDFYFIYRKVCEVFYGRLYNDPNKDSFDLISNDSFFNKLNVKEKNQDLASTLIRFLPKYVSYRFFQTTYQVIIGTFFELYLSDIWNYNGLYFYCLGWCKSHIPLSGVLRAIPIIDLVITYIPESLHEPRISLTSSI